MRTTLYVFRWAALQGRTVVECKFLSTILRYFILIAPFYATGKERRFGTYKQLNYKQLWTWTLVLKVKVTPFNITPFNMKKCELHNVKLLYITQLWLNFTTQENIVLFAEPHLSARYSSITDECFCCKWNCPTTCRLVKLAPPQPAGTLKCILHIHKAVKTNYNTLVLK